MKRTVIRISTIILAAIMLATMLCSCAGAGVKSKLIGTWYAVSYSSVQKIEFEKDGTVSLNGGYSDWEVDKKGWIEIEGNHYAYELTSSSGGRLILTSAGGTMILYKSRDKANDARKELKKAWDKYYY